MQLVAYVQDGTRHPGAVTARGVASLSPEFDSIDQLLTLSQDELQSAVDRGVVVPGAPRLDAPVRPRSHLWAVGWNYLTHFEEGRGKRGDDTSVMPQHPAFFTKAPACVIGPTDPLRLDLGVSRSWDYEAELAVVIGRPGLNIAEADALSHVFGYLVANDVTARDVQRQHGGQWSKGKSLDGTCPLGPVLVTSDEVDPQALTIRCLVNDQVMQEAGTDTMAFSISRIIAELSRGMSLSAGDVILTGTPAGVGYSRNPPVFLQAGDVLVSEVAQGDRILGRLTNTVVDGTSAY